MDLFKEAKIQLSDSNVIVCHGATYVINASTDAFVRSGDEIIMMEPSYVHHVGRLCARTDITLKTFSLQFNSKTQKFEIDYESLKKVLTPKSRLLIFTNPGNPSTRSFTRDEFKQIGEIIKDFPNLIVVEDAAYFMYQNNKHPYLPFACACPELFDRTISVYSGGKTFNVTGVRVGFGIGSPELLRKMAQIQAMELSLSSSFD